MIIRVKHGNFFRFNDQPPGQVHIAFLGTFSFQCFFSDLHCYVSPNIRSRGGICLLLPHASYGPVRILSNIPMQFYNNNACISSGYLSCIRSDESSSTRGVIPCSIHIIVLYQNEMIRIHVGFSPTLEFFLAQSNCMHTIVLEYKVLVAKFPACIYMYIYV